MSTSHLRDLRHLLTAAELARIMRVWRGVLLIVGAGGHDGFAVEVARLGRALRSRRCQRHAPSSRAS